MIKRFKDIINEDNSELKKIADAISSIDELIRLEEEKLKQMKKHREGLIQQLTPQEGQLAPKLRFPEFKEKNFDLEAFNDPNKKG